MRILLLTVMLGAGVGWRDAVAQNARVSGTIRDAAGGNLITNAHVKMEGAALANRENSQVLKRGTPNGAFQFEVPPGIFDLWVVAPDFQEVKIELDVPAGAKIERDITLVAAERSHAYRVETVPLPRHLIPEVSGVSFTPKGSMVLTNRRGDVWIRDVPGDQWRRFATGMYEGFGLVALSESEVLVAQRPELTRVRDTDNDGRADAFETLADEWGITGNYHEFTYGLARDRVGNVYFGSGMVSYGQGRELPWVRGQARKDLYMPWTGKGPVPDGHRSIAQYQGWVFQVSAEGKFTPFASGFRQPLGIGVSPQNELFVTDVSGAWVATSTFMHVERDGFYGHPDSLKWHPKFKDKTLTIEDLLKMRRPPTVYLPRGLMGTSPGQPLWDTTGGKFGPFRNQVFLGDVTNLIMRVDLEKVAGAYQGAAFPFLRGQGLRLGGMHHSFGPDGALYIAQTVRGWMPTEGNEGIQRVTWTGETPTEVLNVRISEKGFVMRFTDAMSGAAAEPNNYQFRRFQYNYHPLDGSLRVVEADVPVTTARLAPDGLSVDLELVELQPGFIYEFTLSEKMVSRSKRPIANRIGYYTANRLLSGETKPRPSKLIAQTAALRPGDAARGAEIFKLNCVACHQADGKGSAQIGTPDYTAENSPLKKPDEELLAIIANGKTQPDGKMMPPFGNVLPPQALRDVLVYLRAAFLKTSAGK